MRVEDLMSRGAHCCRESDSLEQAARIMWEQDIGAVPVVDEGNRLIGILTDRDITMASLKRGRALNHIDVGDTMTRDVAAVKARDSITDAERTMESRQIRRLPVVDNDRRVIGLLSLNDLATHLAGRGSTIGVPASDVARTLRAVSVHRAAHA